MKNLLSADIEDYYSIVARDQLGVSVPVSRKLETEVMRLLDLFDELAVRATCFIVGSVAKARPDLVHEIAARGHEVASHGFGHLVMSRLSRPAFAEDLSSSICLLEDITGKAVTGFRAPAFSLKAEHAWAFDIMADLGVRFDSSVRIRWPFKMGAGLNLVDRAARAGIMEVPSFALGLGSLAVPVGGGSGLRLIPGLLTSRAMTRINRRGWRVPLYLHPYDLTMASQNEWPASSFLRALRVRSFDWFQRLGRSWTVGRLVQATNVAGVETIGQILATYSADPLH